VAFDPFASGVLSTDVFERPGCILLVDAEETFRRGLASKLQEHGHTVLSASDGQSALKLAQDTELDLALLEVQLPDMNALDLCRRLRAGAKRRYLGVILMSALQDPQAQVRSIECGANDFLSKPIDWPVLRARLGALLKYQRAIASLQTAHDNLEARVQERTSELLAANASLEKEGAYRKQIEKALKESEERYALAARGANDGLWDWNLAAKEIYLSPRWKSMLGYEPQEIGEDSNEWFKRVHPDDMRGLREDIETHIRGNSAQLEHEYRVQHKDGTWHWVLCRGMAVRGPDGQPYRMAGSQTDISARKLAEMRSAHDALHDDLTGLANRVLFMDRLGHALRRVRQSLNVRFAVLLLGIDRLQIINDSLGFQTGNQLLLAFGERVQSCLRPTDTIARLGGDEFGLLLEDVRGLIEATALANSIHQALTDPFALGEQSVFVTASVGIVLSKPKYERAEDLLRDAYTAMHSAKASGTARHETFHSGMHAQVVTLLHLENDLRQAIKGGEFRLCYQPIVSLESGRITDFEALIRWERPPFGLIQPGEFIPLAEETELILPITLWVLREACAQLRVWRGRFPAFPPFSVSVNISGKMFSQDDMHEQIAEVLKQTGVQGADVKLEITEGVLMEKDDKHTLASLGRLKSMDLRLMIDDFGTGYSSLSYLHRLPMDILKIDRSFVSKMGLEEKNSEIVRTIKALAGNLGMAVVAEGVESAQQLASLRQLKCEYGQGYYFAKPLDPGSVEKLLAENPKW